MIKNTLNCLLSVRDFTCYFYSCVCVCMRASYMYFCVRASLQGRWQGVLLGVAKCLDDVPTLEMSRGDSYICFRPEKRHVVA